VSDQHHTDPPPPDPAPPGAAVQVLAHLVRLDETGRLALLAVHGAYTLALIAGWDILMGIGFQRSRAAWEPSPETPYPPALYPVPLYMHLATVMIIHLVLLVAFARIRRAAAHLA